MKKVKTSALLLVLTGFILGFGNACRKPHHPQNNFSNYIKKDNTYYKLDSAVVFYDSVSTDKTLFSLGIHSKDADQNFIVFDYLILQNAYELLPGSYIYQKVPSSQHFQVGKFHDVVLKCNSPVMSGVVYPVTLGTLVITRDNNAYEVKGDLVMDGKKYLIQFKGPIQHIKNW
jgi:hypothetical protein